MWRPRTAGYDAFGAHLARAQGLPTYLPWPLGSGWQVTDFGVVVGADRALATVAHVAGSSALDGPVEVLVVSEEPGTGLGARCAGTIHSDPGAEIAGVPATAKVRLDSQSVPLWPVSASHAAPDLDRSVLAGEAEGRWLWIVLRPASAILLLHEEWTLTDVSGFGPQLLDLPFGGHPPSW
ncbi:hypothetical protein IE331_11500 [Nocardioides sp. MJB4]|uniref:Uncharacterized protein n=1 Tax=Nocardioides donggukensis TaxID=2774019 RepID=A0A927K4D4_9ACTN|nr:hypothetical protein [Nocardioides donggukensis]